MREKGKEKNRKGLRLCALLAGCFCLGASGSRLGNILEDVPSGRKCALCEEAGKLSLSGCLGQQKLAFVSLNTFDMVCVEMPGSDQAAPEEIGEESASIDVIGTGDGGFTVLLTEHVGSGYAQGTISFGKDASLEPEKAASFLCRECQEKIVEEACGHAPAGDGENVLEGLPQTFLGVGAMDLSTGELRLLEEDTENFLLGDYQVACRYRQKEDGTEGLKMDFLVTFIGNGK